MKVSCQPLSCSHFGLKEIEQELHNQVSNAIAISMCCAHCIRALKAVSRDQLDTFKYLKVSRRVCGGGRTVINEQPNVIWLDNFSKTLARQHPTVERGVWTPMLWTVAAVKRLHPSVRVSMDLVYDGEDVHSAMPLTIVGDPDELHAHITSQMTVSSMYDEAMCVIHNVRRVPPKLPSDSWAHQVDIDRMSESVDGLHRFHPIEVNKHNIGANEGLMLVLKDLELMLAPGRYAVVVADVNVYMRILKVSSLRFCSKRVLIMFVCS